MGRQFLIVATLCSWLVLPALSQASTGDVSMIIEKFVDRQFPNATGHYWVINETQWEGDEMVVDVYTIVKERRDTEPTLNRFLLLIVAGELKGSQMVPLEPGADCRGEDV